MLRSEILANRQKVIAFLKQPKRIKAEGKLDRGNGKRCCLGHMCYILKVPRTNNIVGGSYGYGEVVDRNYAPNELIHLLGLYTYDGGLGNKHDIQIPTISGTWLSLAVINDSTGVTPQLVGKYLESVIQGGLETPWKDLSDYPESL